MKTYGGVGGSQKSSKVMRGDHFSYVTFKGGNGEMSPCLATYPLNNNRSLIGEVNRSEFHTVG